MIASDEIWPRGPVFGAGGSPRSRREMMSFSHAATNRPTQKRRRSDRKKERKTEENEMNIERDRRAICTLYI